MPARASGPSQTSIRAELFGEPGDLSRMPGVEEVSIADGVLHARVDPAALPDLIRVLAQAGVRSLVSHPPTLEELFLRHYRVDR